MVGNLRGMTTAPDPRTRLRGALFSSDTDTVTVSTADLEALLALVPDPGVTAGPRRRYIHDPAGHTRAAADARIAAAGLDAWRTAAALHLPEVARPGVDCLTGLVLRECKTWKHKGLQPFHVHNSFRTHAGWPDLFIRSPHGVIVRELKREYGPTAAVSDAQRDWLDWFTGHGYDTDVWYPSDYYGGRVIAELQALVRVDGPR